MKKHSVFPSMLFFALGMLCGTLALVATLYFLQEPVCLWSVPDNAVSCVQNLMDGICQSDYESVSREIQGHPDLGLDKQPDDAIAALLWEAYQSTCSYQFEGDMYSTENGLAQDVRFEALDVNAVLARAGELWPERLTSELDSMSSTASVYDENGNLKEELIRRVLLSTMEQVLQQDAPMARTNLTLQLTYQDKQWLVKPDSLLLKIICGGITA